VIEVRPNGLFLGSVCLEASEGPPLSIERQKIAGADLVVLFGTGRGRMARHLLDLGARRLVVYEPDPAWARQAATYCNIPRTTFFADLPPLLGHLVEVTRPGEVIALIASPEYHDCYQEQYAAVTRTINEAETLKKIRGNTIRRRYNHSIEAALGNLRRLDRVPMYTNFRAPLTSRPAIIVSAGPSLDKNAHLLSRARDFGAYVLTVNTAAPAVQAAGCPIDILACIEAMDVSLLWAILDPAQVGMVALDISSNAANFDALPDVPSVAFMPSNEPFINLADAIGSTPLAYGSSVATAAFALAYVWGADPIILVGQDLAYTGGRIYATGTGREEMKVALSNGVATFEHSEEFIQAFRDKGIPAPPSAQPAIDVPGWGGAKGVFTTFDLLLFTRWFEMTSHHIRTAPVPAARRRLINATEGGASIRGFEEMTLEATLADLATLGKPRPHGLGIDPVDIRDAHKRRLTPANVRNMRASIESTAQMIADAAWARDEAKLRKLMPRSAFVDCHAAPALLALKDANGPDRREATFKALRKSALTVARLV
jgi:hypothetical protein